MKNPKLAAVFQAAKALVPGHYYICHAIDFTGAPPRLRAKARAVILKRLGRESTYGLWLREHHSNTYRKMTRADILAGRQQWLDSLVEEFS